MKNDCDGIDKDLIISSRYAVMAGKYCVEDQGAALLPGTRITNILGLLESGLPISNIRLEYLRGKGLWALLQYARKEVGFAEFLKAAKSEQSARCLLKATEIEQEKTKEKLREAEWRAKEAAMFDSIKRGRERVRAEKRAFDADPENIAKSKQLKLRGKYGFSQFVDKNHYPQLMDIVRRIDQGERLSKNEVAWLMTTGNKTDNSYKNYYTEELREGYHQNEAEFHANEFKKKKDPWLAVNASGHYRKGNRAAIADLMLSGIDVGRVKNLKLKSALCTTHGGVKRDLNKKEDALALGEQAHSLTPQDYRPCTLLGAVNIEMGHYELGHSWYAKAVDRGYTEEGVDAELRGIFMRADESEREKLREYLLEIDLYRYNWAKKKENLN